MPSRPQRSESDRSEGIHIVMLTKSHLNYVNVRTVTCSLIRFNCTLTHVAIGTSTVDIMLSGQNDEYGHVYGKYVALSKDADGRMYYKQVC